MNKKYRSSVTKAFLFIILGFLCWVSNLNAQVSVCIEDIRANTEEGCIDSLYDITVKWSISDASQLDQLKFDVYCARDTAFTPGTMTKKDVVVSDTTKIFKKIRVEIPYYLMVVAINKQTGGVADSSEIFEYRLRKFQIGGPTEFFISPANILLWGFQNLISKILDTESKLPNLLKIYHESTIFGQIAFEVICLFFFFGMFIWIIKIWPILRGTRIFPFQRRYDIKNNEPTEVNDIDYMIEKAEEYDLFSKPEEPDKLRELIINRLTRREFHGGKLHWGFRFFDLICYYIRRIFLWARHKWHGRKTTYKYDRDIRDIRMKHMSSYVLLESALNAGDSVKETCEAMENRAAADFKNLRRASGLDLIWGLAVTSPLLGLFGTVTGLSDSFRQISISPGDPMLITKLGSGIFEALWTTIFGLMFGILFMIIYYYYDYKLNRIYQIWEQFYIDYISIFKMNMKLYLPLDKNGKRKC